eukprot:SAG31_NODE_3832_length_3839_cov_7.354813_2_plen_304_part_00
MIRVGKKHLFIQHNGKQHVEVEPLCLLDFYVHESRQRSGYGHELFTHVLRMERVEAHALGYDRPSPKLLAFLRKHFGLTAFTPQANNFVLFHQYFRPPSAASQRPRCVSKSSSVTSTRNATSSRPSSSKCSDTIDAPEHSKSSHAHAWAAASTASGQSNDNGQMGCNQPGQASAVATQTATNVKNCTTSSILAPPITINLDEFTRATREGAVLTLKKAADNCVTSTQPMVKELTDLMSIALESELVDTETIHKMATNLRRGRLGLVLAQHTHPFSVNLIDSSVIICSSSVSYFIEAWRSRLGR